VPAPGVPRADEPDDDVEAHAYAPKSGAPKAG
jgi:hypothetical protein